MPLSPQFEIKKCLCELQSPVLENQFNDENKLVSNYEQIENIKKEKEGQFLEIFYINKKNIHDVLYNANEIIVIDDIKTRKLSDLFYLDLLIMDNLNIVNYNFSKESIIRLGEDISNLQKGIKKAIIAKIMHDLIENYKGFGIYDEKINEKSLSILSKLCIKEIKEQIKSNKLFLDNNDINNIMSMSIDELYALIIMKLFQSNSFLDENILNIVNDLDLENINITENIYNELKDILISKKQYYIEALEDFINIKKVNFYYILLKYILKEPFYIYHFTFLYEARKLLLSLINNNIFTFLALISDKDSDIKNKIDFIIKKLTDFDYYYNKYLKIKNCDNFNKIIKDERFKFGFPLIQIWLDLKIEETNFDENYLNYLVKQRDLLYDIIKKRKFKKISKIKKSKLFNYLKDKNNKLLLLKIFNKKEYNIFEKLDVDNPEEYFEDNEKDNENDSIQIKSSIIENKINENIEDLNKLSEYYVDSTSMIEQTYTIQDIQDLETEIKTEMINDKISSLDLKKYKKSDKYKIIEYNKTLELERNFSRSYFYYTKNISKGHYLIGGNRKEIILYNSFYEKKLEIDLFSKPKIVYELKNGNNNEEEIELIACCNNELISILINLNDYSYKIKVLSEEYDINYNTFFNLGDKYLTCGVKGGFLLYKNNKNYEINKIFESYYINGINITEKICIFISNNLVPYGKNNLLIYDFNNDEIIKQISDYSFKISYNGLYLINMNKIKSININKQLLFCSCSSRENKKIGFLIINIDLDKKEFIESFYDTEDFEPHCFCQILIVENNNPITDDICKEDNIVIKETEFFFVGGFDPMKRMGCIKLYKIKYDKDSNKINIKYLIDIVTENNDEFKGFDMDISCITQSRITGNFLITCLDGNIYLFKPPNLELLL